MLEELFKAVILGVVEGVTEFLPISSTGHLIVTAQALNLEASLRGTFEIFIQIGAIVAVLVFYRQELRLQMGRAFIDRSVQFFWLGVLLAFLPAAVVGFVFSDAIDAVLFNPTVVGLALVGGGILFLSFEYFMDIPPLDAAESPNVTPRVSLRQAFIVGLCQLLALIPGMSRSGMSILGGLMAGLSRQAATRFSFYLAMPTLGIATLYSLVRDLDEVTAGGAQNLLLLGMGALVSGVVAWSAIAWLLRYIANHNFVAFAWYRIVAGGLILLLVAVGWL
ncbi:MAG: undecaprenyl-diphosphate phosphatase [Anaerolineae bacterium]|nr:undecaprenyl-diphosphate phosphatase [Anaerolineae bacterium]MDW8171114.1 undecaprenyl-diphosphate phosphatase [Anaerolineae bacterium]